MKKQLFTIILALCAMTGFAQNDESGADWNNQCYFQYDCVIPNDNWGGYNRHFAFGDRFYYGDVYNIGGSISLDFYRFRRSSELIDFEGATSHKIAARSMQVKTEIFQRIAIKSWGVNWDLGAFGGIALTRKARDYQEHISAPGETFPYDKQIVTHYTGCTNMNRFQYGITTRIGKDFDDLTLSLIGYYRLSNITTGNDPLFGNVANQPSRWSVGLEVAF